MFVLLALLVLALVLFLCLIDGAKGVYYLRVTYLAFVLGALFFFLNIMPKDSLVIAIGELNGSVSLVEPMITFVIFMVSVSVQISLLGSRRREKEFSYVAVACLGVISLLLPRMIDSYALVWGCVQKACEEGGSKFADLVPVYSVAFSFAATLGVLALLSRFVPPLVNKMPKFSGSSELSVGGGISASCDEGHSELVVGGVAVASGGASRQLASAAVTGVVAGACFSVVSRLFGRR